MESKRRGPQFDVNVVKSCTALLHCSSIFSDPDILKVLFRNHFPFIQGGKSLNTTGLDHFQGAYWPLCKPPRYMLFSHCRAEEKGSRGVTDLSGSRKWEQGTGIQITQLRVSDRVRTEARTDMTLTHHPAALPETEGGVLATPLQPRRTRHL